MQTVDAVLYLLKRNSTFDYLTKSNSGTSVAFKIQVNQLCLLLEQMCWRGREMCVRGFCCQDLVLQGVVTRFVGACLIVNDG